MIRLFIENTEVDVSDFSNYITYAVDDLQNLDSKATPWSKTGILPGTKRNNDVLGNIFEITNANFTIDGQANIGYNFNAARAAKCRLEVNGMQVIKGVFRLLEIINDKGGIEYEFSIIGELGGFIARLANKRLEDLDFSDYDHTYNVPNIVNSWDQASTYNITTSTTFTAATKKIKVTNKVLSSVTVGATLDVSATASNNGAYTVVAVNFSNIVWNRYTEIEVAEAIVNETISTFTIILSKPFGSGIYYNLADYGNVSTDKINFQYTAFRPSLFLREYLDKIITGNGYTWESNFLNSNFAKRIIIPNNSKGLFKNGVTDYINGQTASTQSIGPAIGVRFLELQFPGATLNNFTANGANSIFTYTNPAPTTTKAKLKISGTFKKPQSGDQLLIKILTVRGEEEYAFPQEANLTAFNLDLELSVAISNGETIQVLIVAVSAPFNYCLINIDSAEFLLQKDPPGYIELAIGEQMIVNDTIPKGVFQKDFFTSILKMSNLMVTEDKFIEKHLVIEPYPDFYLLSDFADWSGKIDRSSPIKIKPMSELNARYYQFKFKQDNDYYNEDYRKKFNEGYGDRIYDTAYDFAKDTETAEVIFSASPLFGASGTDKVYPAIYKKSGNGGFEDTIEHNIRIMQVKKITGVSSWNILDGASVLTTLTDYGYAGHLNDPDAPTVDMNFGVTKELYFGLVTGNLSNNLFNAYYSPYLAEITDKDSRLLTAKFRLTEQDIYDLNFRQFIYIDGCLFRISKIVDFNTNKSELTTCELLKVIYTVY